MNGSMVLVGLARVSCILVLLTAGTLEIVDPEPVRPVAGNVGLAWIATFSLAMVEVGLAFSMMTASAQL